MQTVWDPKVSTLEFLAGNVFTHNLWHKHIFHNLGRFKESFMMELLDFLKI